MKFPRLRACLAGAAALSLTAAALAPAPAHAQFGGIVYDPTNYSQNILTAARTLEQINNQIRQLQNQATSLVNEARNLQSLPLILGSSPALLIYARNIWMIYRDRGKARSA